MRKAVGHKSVSRKAKKQVSDYAKEFATSIDRLAEIRRKIREDFANISSNEMRSLEREAVSLLKKTSHDF